MARPSAVLAACLAIAACGAARHEPRPAAGARAARLHESRFTWLDATCSDGSLGLGSLGLERTLTVEVAEGALRLTHESELVTEGCHALDVWAALPTKTSDLWRFEPQASVMLPPGASCGPEELEPMDGTLRLHDDVLEIVTRRSRWCRGYDARFTYRRIEPVPLTPEGVAGRYVAHWNRGDAAAIARLFVERGALVEPFTRTADGRSARHVGREAVQAWHARAFQSARWHAMRLLSVERAGAEGQWAASWEYVDDRLAAPLRGRNLFAMAGGEIFEAELQLLTDPVPAPPATTQTGAGTGTTTSTAAGTPAEEGGR